MRYLGDNTVHLSILRFYFALHVNCHVAQIAYDIAYLRDVLVHLIFTGILRYSAEVDKEMVITIRAKFNNTYKCNLQ